jgi:hypothetical protein
LPTFKETFDRLIIEQHKLAIWEMLYEQLEKFVSKDGRPTPVLRAIDSVKERVSEETIEEVLEEIALNKLTELKQSIEQLQSSTPMDPGGSNEQSISSKARGKSKKGSQAGDPTGA